MSPSPAQFAFGPGIVGVFINVFLFGVEVLLFSTFLTNLPLLNSNWISKPRLRNLAIFIVVSDLADCIFNSVWIYDNLIMHFGDVDSISKADWTFATAPALSSIVSTTVQLFFARRIEALDRREGSWTCWVVRFGQGMALVSGVSGMATAVAIHYVPRYIDFPAFQAPLAIWLIGAVICNVIVTAWMTWWIRLHLAQLPKKATVFHRLLFVIVNNGAIIAIWTTLDLFLYLFVPTGLHIAFNLPLGKLYSISFFLTQIFRGGYSKDNEIISLEPVNPSNEPNRVRNSTAPQLPDPLPSPEHRLAGEDYALAPSQHTNESDRSCWHAASVKAAGIGEDSV